MIRVLLVLLVLTQFSTVFAISYGGYTPPTGSTSSSSASTPKKDSVSVEEQQYTDNKIAENVANDRKKAAEEELAKEEAGEGRKEYLERQIEKQRAAAEKAKKANEAIDTSGFNKADAEKKAEAASEQIKEANEKVGKKLVTLAKNTFNAGKLTKEQLTATGNTNESNLVIDDSESTNNLINRAIIFIARVVGTLGVFTLVIGGYFMVVNMGDDTRISRGKNILLYTSIGLIVTFLSYVIVQYVLSVIYSL